jgi:hypothetical protein
MERIDISKYTSKFGQYPEELLQIAQANDVTLPGIETCKGQALALMGQPEIRGQKYLLREDCEQFYIKIGVVSGDPIQGFNKIPGFKRRKSRGKYSLMYPFSIDKTDIDKRKNVSISGDRDAHIENIKKYWRDNLTEVPNGEWQLGHLDPTIPDSTEANLAWQPPIQGKYRDRFKWDSCFMKMWPTGAELVTKFDKYYTEAEQRALYAHLKSRFEPDAVEQL